MENLLKKLFRKKSNLTLVGLELAREKGLITEEEFLLLESRRANEKLKSFLKKKTQKK